ncbi:GntR family transcriptional regulator/MocR family aminotransferase [Scopulibacillus darangshiensis]|uniref:GntR family transcriptional regulator/MocR family aminotransferase n=1 Tax=Scopulibacillus darangshiensis TaxID=442528 RepID=A0A4R2NIF1_9BACL|nr:PLP-dependent aminotransferase family protein [Scopulibacillus darangshiensis]TCP21058.1 GntR family transcriptional regulator/MocR family aminotransferase [Scopulibacillus darangshiensis]
MFELTPKLDVQSEKPLYVQLYDYIKQEMKAGNLMPHAKLPSKRKLARHLKISLNTVEAAYGQLVAEGYVEAIARKGYFVSDVEQNLLETKGDITHIKEKSYRDHEYIYDFSNIGIDACSFPFGIYRKLASEVLKPGNEQVLMIGHPQGEFELRETIAAYAYESRGVRCSPSQIVIGSGTQYLIKILFQLLQGSIFAVEDPGYHRKLVAFEKGIQNVKMIPLDQDGLMVSHLEDSRANIVFVTPSHQFPCGMIMPVSRRLQLLNWAEKSENRFIIEDDYDSEFRYTGKPIPALQGLDPNNNVIYMSTFSKALLPSLRISYMILPKPLIEAFQRDFFFYAQTASHIDQDILQRFMKEGFWEKHINKMRVVYHKKRDVLVSSISTYFPATAEVIGQDSGLHLLVRPNNGMTEEQLVDRAANFNTRVYPVSAYGNDDHSTVLLGFASLSEGDIPAAVQLLEKAWFQKE